MSIKKDLNDWGIEQLAIVHDACGPYARSWFTGEPVEHVKSLFDEKTGRLIPHNGLQAAVSDAKRDFRLVQPEFHTIDDYANRIKRLHMCLGIDTGITAEQFKAETQRLLKLIQNDTQIANITKGVWLPVVMPQITTDDLGATLQEYLVGVGRSYPHTFMNWNFHNDHYDDLAGAVKIVDGSRHDLLIERMKQGSVMGIYFPTSLQGFSDNACREQMSKLPPVYRPGLRSPEGEGGEGFILSGLDTAIAMIMYVDHLARDWYTPALDLAALAWRSTAFSFFFYAYVHDLEFHDTGPDGCASADGHFSGGLLFLG